MRLFTVYEDRVTDENIIERLTGIIGSVIENVHKHNRYEKIGIVAYDFVFKVGQLQLPTIRKVADMVYLIEHELEFYIIDFNGDLTKFDFDARASKIGIYGTQEAVTPSLTIDQLTLSVETIVISHVCNLFFSEFINDDQVLSIDLIENRPVVPQLQAILPNIFRLNDVYNLNFTYVNNSYEVKSYGHGVTRQVFSELRSEIDKSLDQLDKLSETECYQLGLMIYLSIIYGKIKFNGVSVYFFYKLIQRYEIILHESPSDEYYLVVLLKYLKGDDYEKYYQLYNTYKKNPDELIALDTGLTTHIEFIKYVLDPRTVNPVFEHNLDKLIDGFIHFLERSSDYRLYQLMPMKFWINIMCQNGGNKLSIGFESDTVSNVTITEFRTMFETEFKLLTGSEAKIFIKNICGDCYGESNISNMTIKYNPKVNPIATNSILELTRTEYGAELEFESDDDTPTQIETITIDNYVAPSNPDDLIEYKISTCESSLTIFIGCYSRCDETDIHDVVC